MKNIDQKVVGKHSNYLLISAYIAFQLILSLFIVSCSKDDTQVSSPSPVTESKIEVSDPKSDGDDELDHPIDSNSEKITPDDLNSIVAEQKERSRQAIVQNRAPDMSREDLEKMIAYNSSLSSSELADVMNRINNQYEVAHGDRIPISGMLISQGFNGALIFDSDEIKMYASIVDFETKNIVNVPGLFIVKFNNEGLKVEFTYRLIIVLIPSGMKIASLNGAIYGRGFAISSAYGSGIEAGWLPGKNRRGAISYFAITIGFGLGLSAPKMSFQQVVIPQQ